MEQWLFCKAFNVGQDTAAHAVFDLVSGLDQKLRSLSFTQRTICDGG